MTPMIPIHPPGQRTTRLELRRWKRYRDLAIRASQMLRRYVALSRRADRAWESYYKLLHRGTRP